MKISVVLCTYNRCQTLSETLQSLCRQDGAQNLEFEILVVDNNSKDQTRDVIEAFIRKEARIRYVFEPEQGKSNALNAGISQATGEILAFTDDDVIVDKHWLSNMAHFALEHDFDAMGGKVLAVYPQHTPQWIKDCKNLLTGPIVCYDFGETIQLYNEMMCPFIGANMVVKRKIFEEVGGFHPMIGGGIGTVGEDTEFFHRLKKTNKIIYYNPGILIFHPVDKNRMNLKYFAQWHMSYGRYLIIKNAGNEDGNLIFIFGIPRYLFRGAVNFLWEMIKSVKNKRSFIQAWCGLFQQFGMMQGYLNGGIMNHAKASVAIPADRQQNVLAKAVESDFIK